MYSQYRSYHRLMALRAFLLLMVLSGLVTTIDAALRMNAPTANDNNIIELRIYVDDWAVRRWQTAAVAAHMEWQGNGVMGTKLHDIIAHHIRAIIKGVNNIYTGLIEYGINIEFRISNIYFTKEAIAKETQSGSGRVSRYTALDNFYNWLRRRTSDQPADHSLLLTGLNISSTAGANPIGIARIGEMCDAQYSLSVVELVPPGGLTTLIVAHELGHSLNASHDGDTNVPCPRDNDVMNPIISLNSTHSYIFSTCAARSIQIFIFNLNRSWKGSCLSPARTTVARDNSLPTLVSLTSLDQICQMVHGSQSYFDRGFYGYGYVKYNTVCTSVWCSSGEAYGYGVIAGDGVICGHNKVCSLGMCVASKEQINVPDSCPLGDCPAHAKVRGDMTCSGMAVSGTSAPNCYDSYTQRACCRTCAAFYQRKPGCEYGDKILGCETYHCARHSSTCCQTCRY